MMNNRKSWLILMLGFLVMLQSGLSSPQIVKASELAVKSLQISKSLSPDQRYDTYMNMSLDTKDWHSGMIVSEIPYAVITEVVDVYKLKVFTGVLTRNSDDLIVEWDDIWVNPDGTIRLAAVGITEKISHYFTQNDQDTFHNIRFVGIMPGIDIPTDLEAKNRKIILVPNDGAINYYHIQDASEIIYETKFPHPIHEGAPYSDKVPLAIYPLIAVRTPSDIQTHWAKAFTLDLMKKQIIKGYPDGKIKPSNKLTKAEFISLLIHSLDLQDQEINQTDTFTNWYDPAVSIANSFGIMSIDEMKSFQPNEPLSRIEMVLYLEKAIAIYDDFAQASTELPFQDLNSLSASELHALQTVTAYGLINGYEDGTFRPAGTLTRAEAFAVISKLIHEL
jgi:hypothetical protein